MVNREYEFLDRCARLEVTEFIGVARVLKVNFIGEDGEPRDFEDIFTDVIRQFSKSNRKRKRELLKIVKAATKGKGYHKSLKTEGE